MGQGDKDEATSNLVSESEQPIQESIRELFSGRTTFVVAHRLSTVAHDDIILVMEKDRSSNTARTTNSSRSTGSTPKWWLGNKKRCTPKRHLT